MKKEMVQAKHWDSLSDAGNGGVSNEKRQRRRLVINRWQRAYTLLKIPELPSVFEDIITGGGVAASKLVRRRRIRDRHGLPKAAGHLIKTIRGWIK
eukprot:jgi/Bigna1/144912/aug1.93_g19620